MAKSAILAVQIIADAKQAVSGLDDASAAVDKLGTNAKTSTAGIDSATKAVRDYGDAASSAASQSRDVAGGVDAVGGNAGKATTGLRDMSDAVAAVGFPGLAEGMTAASVGLEAMSGASDLYAVATTVATTATSGLSKAMQFLKVSILTNPIFIIAAIIIAIGAALVLAYMKCETFRRIVDAAFDVVAGAVQVVWDWIVKLAGYVGGYFQTVFTVWKNVAKAAIDIVIGPLEDLWDIIKKVVDWLGRIKWPSPPGWLKDVGGAIGGLFGKAAPVPTSPAVATRVGLPAGRAAGKAAPAGGVTINVQTTGLGASAPQIQDAVVQALRQWSGRNGSLVDARGAVGTRYA